MTIIEIVYKLKKQCGQNRMKKIVTLGMICFMVLSILAFSSMAGNAGTVDKTKIMIPYVNFTASSVKMNGIADESGFYTFTITMASGQTETVAWRQNGVDLHVVLTSNNPGWIAVGWHNKAPASDTGAGPMVGANIITAGNGISRQDTGSYANHGPVAVDHIIANFSSISSSGAKFEFLFPLAGNSSYDQPLTAKSFGYFIFALGTSTNINLGHDGSEGAMYIPKVYIQSSALESYPSSGSTPFASPAVILIALGLVGVIATKKRRKLN